VRQRPTILPDHGDYIARLPGAAERCSATAPLEVAMKSRLLRLAYSLAALAALAAALGAGLRIN
jgi:hypothetical protein